MFYFTHVSALSGEEGKPLLMFFKSVSHVMMRLTSWVVHLAPLGVAFLIAGEILHMKSVLAELTKLVWYLVTVTLGITFHGFVILPLIYSLVTRSLPFKFIGKAILSTKVLSRRTFYSRAEEEKNHGDVEF